MTENLIKLAPSSLDYPPMKCARCFYLDRVKRISIGSFPPPVFSTLDVAQQNYFKDKNTSDLTDQLPPGKIMQKGELPGTVVSTEMKDNKNRKFLIGGRPDIVIKFDNGEFGIIDFKTTNLKSNKAESYRYQLEAYKQIFTNPGATKTAPTPKLSPITHMGVLQFEPTNIFNHDDVNCQLNLRMSYSRLEPDEVKFFKRVTYIMDILTASEPPPFNNECTKCQFVKKQSDFIYE